MTAVASAPLTYRSLRPGSDEVPAPWTFPSYRHLLALEPTTRFEKRGASGLVKPFAFVAEAKGRPVGLILGCLPLEESPAQGELLSLFVDAEHRRRGVATRLVAELEEALAAEGCESLEAVYMTGSPYIDAVEKALARRSWQEPTVRMVVIKGTLDEAMNTPWYNRYRQRKDFELVPWSEVFEQIDELKEAHREDSWIAEDLEPWKFDMSYVEPHSSMGVLLHGELVGWIINHRVDDETVRVTNAHLRPDLSRRARMVPVISESLRRASENGFTKLTLTAPSYHPQMVRFATRWCAPFATFFGETRGVRKSLIS